MSPTEEARAAARAETTQATVISVAREIQNVSRSARRLWYGIFFLSAIAGAGWVAAMKYSALVQAAEFEPVKATGLRNTEHLSEHDRALAEIGRAVERMEISATTATDRIEKKVDGQSDRIDRLSDTTRSAVRAFKEPHR